MGNNEFEACELKKRNKKGAFKAVLISCIVTFILTAVLVVKISKNPFFNSVVLNGYNNVSSEVSAYLDAVFLYETDEEKMAYGACKGMVEALGDPYTKYLSPEEFEEYLNDGAGNYIGIGVVFTISENGEIFVVGAYPDSPGSEAGLESGDVLVSVDSKPANSENYDEIISYIRGEHISIYERENTSFELEYLRADENGNKKSHKVSMKRRKIHVNSIASEMKDNKIGYVSVSAFNKNTHEEFCEAYDELLEKGMRELIIDLRDNGGGDFNVAVEMAGYFVEDNSLVVYTVDKNDKKKEYYSKEKRCDIKPVILINGHSASASEVFTAALRDNNAARAIVGEKSFGKGITQNVYEMKNGGGLIVTVDTYYTPSNDKIHEKGIEPTDIVEIDEKYKSYPVGLYTAEIDKQLRYAIDMLK